MNFRKIVLILIFIIILVCAFFYYKSSHENRILNKIIERLSADSRIAEVIVTDANQNKLSTTIKFLEYDSQLKPLEPKYFTFSSNIIQFQSLVIRFEDFYVKKADALKGKSAYLFMKAFSLSGENPEVYDINRIGEVPSGYVVEGKKNLFEKEIWRRFWDYALNEKAAKSKGIKNAQIEAPGTKFLPGYIYTIKIEHDGGMRIDAKKLPDILKKENKIINK